jgi:hypothetical protein
VIEVGAVNFEFCQIRLEEMKMLGIKGVNVTVKELAGNGIVKGLSQVLKALQHLSGDHGNRTIQGAGGNAVENVGCFVRANPWRHWRRRVSRPSNTLDKQGMNQEAAEQEQHEATDETFYHDVEVLNQKCLKLA